MLLNCGVGEDSRVPWTARRSVHPKGNQSWIFTGRADAKAETPILWPPDVKELIHWKRPWYWEGLGVGGKGDDRGWDDWMVSSTQWTWIWVNSRSWWWTERPGVCSPWGRKESDTTERLNWTDSGWWEGAWGEHVLSFHSVLVTILTLDAHRTGLTFYLLRKEEQLISLWQMRNWGL